MSGDREFAYQVVERTMRSYAVATWGTWSEAEARERTAADAGAGRTQIIQLASVPIGLLCIDRRATHVELEQLFILPEHQRRGIGAQVLQGVLSEARDAGLAVRLRVLRVNPAKRFYERHGFAVVSETAERLFMEHVPAAMHVSPRDDLCIPDSLPQARGLRRHAQAQSLEVAEVGADGREHLLTPPAAAAWRALKAAANDDGSRLFIVSAFRSIERQAEIVRRKLASGIPLEDVLSVSAPPGYSEHHTGRAIDLSTPGCAVLEVEFADTPAFAWLEKFAGGFGYSLSYPMHNREGYQYEPWHWCFHAAATDAWNSSRTSPDKPRRRSASSAR